MPTSGTVTFRLNQDQLITQAALKLGGGDMENSTVLSANQITFASQLLNALVKMWETQGLELWERKYAVVFPQPGQTVFVLGGPGPGGDHACFSTPISAGFVQTTALSGSGTSLVVASVTGSSLNTAGTPGTSITSGYNIGIELDDGTVQWTTVNGAPSGTTITLSASLTGGVTSGANVFCYQTKMIRPLRVLDGFVRQISRSNDIPISMLSRENYNRFGSKTSMGTPVQAYYDPQKNSGHLYLYPTFQTADQLLFLEIQKPIEDFSASSDDFDLPQEWAMALIYNLAYWMAPDYEVPKEKFDQIRELAKQSYEQLVGWDQENASVFMQPGTWVYDLPK